MATPTLMELAKAGAHFGHRRALLNPPARRFVYEVREGVALIDLEKTQQQLELAKKALEKCRQEKRPILLVGTKRALRGAVKEIATEAGVYHLTERWMGGFLTNFASFQEHLKRSAELRNRLETKAAKLPKSERLIMASKLERFDRFFDGVAELKELPALIVLASASTDKIAIIEANRVKMPIIAIVDTDINPETITYPIPANDDAPKAVELILRALFEESAKPSSKPKATKAADDEAVVKTVKKEKAKTAPKAAVKKVAAKVAPVKKEKPAAKTAKKTVKTVAKAGSAAGKAAAKK